MTNLSTDRKEKKRGSRPPRMLAFLNEAGTEQRGGCFTALLLLVASIEMARIQKHGPAVPIELEKDYFSAIATIPETVGMTASQPWDHWYCVAALATIAAAKGHADCAEAILELVPDNGASLG